MPVIVNGEDCTERYRIFDFEVAEACRRNRITLLSMDYVARTSAGCPKCGGAGLEKVVREGWATTRACRECAT